MTPKKPMPEDLVTKTMPSPVGRLRLVANDEALVAVLFENNRASKKPPANARMLKRHPVLDRAETQLRQYFRGARTRFDVPLAPQGTQFQQKVWNGLKTIPFGMTLSYAGLAGKIKAPSAARAVGMANGRNPIPIIIPCHRVIGGNGKLAGFSSGLGIKSFLLKLEGLSIKE